MKSIIGGERDSHRLPIVPFSRGFSNSLNFSTIKYQAYTAGIRTHGRARIKAEKRIRSNHNRSRGAEAVGHAHAFEDGLPSRIPLDYQRILQHPTWIPDFRATEIRLTVIFAVKIKRAARGGVERVNSVSCAFSGE